MRILVALTIAGSISIFGAGCGDDGGGSTPDSGGNQGSDGGSDGGGQPDGGGGSTVTGCKKVDLVFAVDASGSMGEERMALAQEVFPAFATALLEVGGGLEDYRIGVLDACPNPASFHTRGAATENCRFQSNEVWMTSDSTALNDEFSCVGDIYTADVGCTGTNDDEQPVSAITASLQPPYIDDQNAGFLRDDALLVVVAITDEDEQPTPDRTAEEVYAQLVAVKGDVRKIVMLGIGGASNCNGAYGRAEPASKLIDITNQFIAEERGVFWDLCVGQLQDGLTEAMEVIEQACTELPPIE